MTYEVSWSATGRRAIGRLHGRAATVIVEYIYGFLAENPHRAGHELHFELEGKRSARRGDFRVIYEIDEDEQTVVILAIAHRSDVYRST